MLLINLRSFLEYFCQNADHYCPNIDPKTNAGARCSPRFKGLMISVKKRFGQV